MYIDASSVIAVALVALVLIFIRISWTLKDIHETLAARGTAAAAPAHAQAETVSAAAVLERKAVTEEAAIDDTEIAAVIAIAHAALRAAV
jgi:zona occludens toxin (predicted ATPase)